MNEEAEIQILKLNLCHCWLTWKLPKKPLAETDLNPPVQNSYNRIHLPSGIKTCSEYFFKSPFFPIIGCCFANFVAIWSNMMSTLLPSFSVFCLKNKMLVPFLISEYGPTSLVVRARTCLLNLLSWMSWVGNIWFLSPLVPQISQFVYFWGKCVYFSIFEW